MKETINRRYSKEMLLEMQSEMIDKIQFQEQSLLTIRESKALIMEKWQNFLQVILPIQLEVIDRYGFGEGQVALSLFNEAYANQAATSRDLQELNRKKWTYLFEKAFNVSKVNDTSLEQIRQLIADIAEAMTSKQFLEQIDGITTSFSEDKSLVQKRQAILKALFPLHMSIMEQYGFKGETGYVHAQRAIMDYYYDSQIAQAAMHAQSVLFQRAKLEW